MSARELYRRFAKICEKWPKDQSKQGRDYAELFRQQLADKFPHGEHGLVKDPIETEKYLVSLERLVNNLYFNENPLKKSSATGNLDLQIFQKATSNEIVNNVGFGEEESLMRRLLDRLQMQFSSSHISKSQPKALTNDTKPAKGESK